MYENPDPGYLIMIIRIKHVYDFARIRFTYFQLFYYYCWLIDIKIFI